MIKIGRSKSGTSALLAYPGFGCPTDDGDWRVYTSGVAWREPIVFNMRQRMIIRMLAGAMQASPEDVRGEVFQSRISPFMAEANDRRPIVAELAGHTYRLRKKTRKNGHFRDFLVVPGSDVAAHSEKDAFGNQTLEYRVDFAHRRSKDAGTNAVKDSGHGPATGQIHLLAKEGTCVVSDIDDTIKDSFVSDRKQLLNNTFLRDFKSIAGMAEIYRQWSDRGASFHYVSSSPWQLFESLHEMNHRHRFPAGTMHLRNFRLRDQLFRKVILRRHGKTTAIRSLMENLPHRKFILIGDSGEKDPEIYRKICRKYPDRVKALFIRELPERPLDIERLRRLQKAVPKQAVFGKFTNSVELQALAERTY